MGWAPDYATSTELGGYLRIDDLDDDVEAALAVAAASRAIDDHTNRQFGLLDAPEARLYTARYDYDRRTWVVDVDDFQTDTGLVVTVDGDPVATFDLEPINAAGKGRPWTRIGFTAGSEVTPTGCRHEVSATARWGWTEFPLPVAQATLLQGARFFQRRGAPFGVAGSPEMGSELRLLSKVDPDVAVMLRGWGRPRASG